MKNLLILPILLFLAYSCKKEESVPNQECSVCNEYWIHSHYAYFKGFVSDSITGAALNGYKIHILGPKDNYSAINDGTYKLFAYWFEGKQSYKKPYQVSIEITDSLNQIIKKTKFNGNLLVENETVIIDFQVAL